MGKGCAQSRRLLLCHPAWEGTCGQDRCIICAALASAPAVFVSAVFATTARLLAACRSGAALPACDLWAKLSFLFSSFFFSFFLFLAHFVDLEYDLQTLSRPQLFLAEMWCLQIKYVMNTMKMRSICQI